MNSISYSDFCNYTLSKKVDFFDSGLVTIIQSVDNNQIFKFLKQIVFDIDENAYVRKSALSSLVESVFLGKIKDRQALSVLIDEWENSSNVFLELQRIKDLYYFYDIEPDIEKIFNSYLSNEEFEIVSEAKLNLGYIQLQKAFETSNKNDMLMFFQSAIQNFKDSNDSIENRIDAKFYYIVSSILVDFLTLKTSNIDNYLNQLSEILREKWLYSFDFKENAMDVSFFKTLTSICNILLNNPNDWTDYTFEFHELYECYSEIKNQEIKKRLNISNLSNAFISMCEDVFIEPYFALNFHSQIIKIDNCILKYPENSPLYDFLMHIKKLAEDDDFKKKMDLETVEQVLKNCFPLINEAKIQKTVKKIKDKNNPLDLLNAYDELNSNSFEKFMDDLVSACLKLQANRIYKGDFSEDDRNTYISDLLDISGYQTKDQTRQGSSYAGKSAGEIDILIKDSRGLPLTIIEALNLTSVDKEYIKKHIEKLFNNYDTAGLEYNFILVYANVVKFQQFCTNYIDYISKKHKYKFDFKFVKELNDYHYTDFKLYKAEHIRHGNKTFLYHVIINLNG